MRTKNAFTLIELLIVVAIIAILAAIAVPNFLEAQNRSKVSATMADMRTLVLAVESYNIDWDDYPYYPIDTYQPFVNSGFMGSDNSETVDLLAGYTPVSLTTPLAYLTSLPKDVFSYAKGATDPNNPDYRNALQLYQWDHSNTPRFFDSNDWRNSVPDGIKYVMIGVGPDGTTHINTSISELHSNAHEYLSTRGAALGLGGFYDPTNGTVSPGDIVYHGPGLGFEPTVRKDFPQ